MASDWPAAATGVPGAARLAASVLGAEVAVTEPGATTPAAVSTSSAPCTTDLAVLSVRWVLPGRLSILSIVLLGPSGRKDPCGKRREGSHPLGRGMLGPSNGFNEAADGVSGHPVDLRLSAKKRLEEVVVRWQVM